MIKLTTFLSAVLFPFVSVAEGHVSELLVIPVPREIERTSDQPLGRAIIELSSPGSKGLAAAKEINQRLGELGLDPLPVVHASQLNGQNETRRIVLSVNSQSDAPDKEQGYFIDTTHPEEIHLVGHDDQGLLWAAVTFRHLLQAGPDGSVSLLGAKIRDWPDFIWRHMAVTSSFNRRVEEKALIEAIRTDNPALESMITPYLEDSKRMIDFNIRLKYNMMSRYSDRKISRLDKFVEHMGSEEKADRYFALVKEVHDYGWDRGLGFVNINRTNIGILPDDDNDPLISRCAVHPNHQQYFCWSLDGHNRLAAEEGAKYMDKAGWKFQVAHVCDGGRVENPAHWNERCEACLERWGDDRGAADGHIYHIWQEAFNKYAPDTRLSGVQYPYDTASLRNPDSPGAIKTMAYWKRLADKIPDGFGVCLREREHPLLPPFYDIFKDHPIQMYWYPEPNRGQLKWNPLLTGRVSNAMSFYRPGMEDYSFCKTGGPIDMAMLTGILYTWNTTTAGAEVHLGSLDPIRDGARPEVFYEKHLPMVLKYWYGPEIASDLVDIYSGAISISYLLQPDKVTELCSIENSLELMNQQYSSLHKGVQGLDRIWRRIESGESSLLRPAPRNYFYGLSEQAGRGLAYGSFNLTSMTAEQARNEGRTKKEILAVLDEGILRLQRDISIAQSMDRRTKSQVKDGYAKVFRKIQAEHTHLYENPQYGALLEKLDAMKLKVSYRSGLDQDPATHAVLEAVQIVTSKFVGGSGTENHLKMAVSLSGDGKLNGVKISVEILEPSGRLIDRYSIIEAKSLETPWTSKIYGWDLGVDTPHVILRFSLQSNEFRQTYSQKVEWEK